jgi:LysR family glycine cleavage system transcriptional activator
MSGRFGRLPSIQALMGFEAAARLQSFSRAGEELHMTQSAVSHQIRSLEELLGQALFRRLGRTVELTDAGIDMLETTNRTLGTLASGLKRLDFYTKPGSVIFSCPPAWASHWLLQRLPRLRSSHPQLEPWIHTGDDQFEFEHSEIDCAIWYGEGSWPGLESHLLYPELLSPVCSPDYAQRCDGINSPACLLQAELLHDERWDGWNAWFASAGLQQTVPVSGLNFSDPGILLDSALAGHGVALASLTLAADALAQGRLLQPFAQTVDTGKGWYLVGEPRRIQRQAASDFWHWLLQEAGSSTHE